MTFRKRIFATIISVALLTGIGICQYVPPTNAQNSVANGAAGPAGLVAVVSGLLVSVTPGPIYCNGGLGYIHNSQVSLPALQTTAFFIAYNCPTDTVYWRLASAPQNTDILLATATTTASAASITDVRVAASFPLMTDYMFDVPLTNCQEAASANAGANDGKMVLSGTLPNALAVLRGQITTTGNNVFTCSIIIPTKIGTTGKGVVSINDVTLLVSTQTTQPTSVTAVSFKSTTGPAAAASEVASSATFTDLTGGSVAAVPNSAQFAGFAVSGAGQLYTLKIAPTTPPAYATDLFKASFSISFNQSAAAAQIVDLAGLQIHYTFIPF